MKHICMVAAENDVIPGGKVGGIGDVVRDIPRALANADTRVTVMIPAYDAFHELPGAQAVGACIAGFRGTKQRIELYELYAERDENVRYLVLHHRMFGAGGKGRVYCDDDANQPFATDASKFALFSAAVMSAIANDNIGTVDVLHLHDWHAALALVLLHFDPEFASLKSVRTVLSIHNLALQGIRPFADDASSLQAWFPHLHYNPVYLADPRWPHCINPLAAAIRLADKVHTVSPTYAQEIVQANRPADGFHGGEGLETDLQRAMSDGKLVGIINGIEYPKGKSNRLKWKEFVRALSDELLNKISTSQTLRAIDYVAHQRILACMNHSRPKHIITSVGRLTAQKVALLLHPMADGRVPLDVLAQSLKGQGMLLLLGSGDTKLEDQCQAIASKHPHMVFINVYSQALSELLFANGDLFLMPSSFEPCGISQMLAMKDSQPCLAHAVGGLKDTISDNEDGFLFEGNSMDEQVQALLQRSQDILRLRERKPAEFTRIANAASTKRFDWSVSAQRYLTELYS